MVRFLLLVLPALIPSWEFFKTIEPSPRVQWRVCDGADDWQDFRARPQRLTWLQIIRRLFWNPDWNEALYGVSLAERLTIQPTDHSYQELCGLIRGQIQPATAQNAQFRLVFVQREDGQVRQDITFLSDPFAIADP